MAEIQPKVVTREEFNRELVQALDDLVSSARHHGELIQAAIDKPVKPPVARETSPPYGEVPERLDRIEARLDRLESRMDRMEARLDRMERTLTEIRARMATKVELEATNENVMKMADGYITIGRRLDAVADLLKLRVVMP